MKVLVLGATGYIGSVVTEHLARGGHDVVALLRGEPPISTSIHDVRVGDLADPSTLVAAVTDDVDAVLHLAAPTGDAAVDLAATDALLRALSDSGRAFVYTSGVWVLGATHSTIADEDSPTRPIDLVRHRPEVEQRVLEAANQGVRSVVVRPGVVHGRGGGIPALLVELARERGTGVHVGAATVRWPMVHVDDLAELFVAALERARAGTLVHAVGEEAVSVVELATAAARAAGAQPAAVSWPVPEAAPHLGQAFAEALALDQACSGARARSELGWSPNRSGAVADLGAGSYVPRPLVTA